MNKKGLMGWFTKVIFYGIIMVAGYFLISWLLCEFFGGSC